MLESVSSVVFNSRKFNKNLKVCQKKRFEKYFSKRKGQNLFISFTSAIFSSWFRLIFQHPNNCRLKFHSGKKYFLLLLSFWVKISNNIFYQMGWSREKGKIKLVSVRLIVLHKMYTRILRCIYTSSFCLHFLHCGGFHIKLCCLIKFRCKPIKENFS